MYKMKLTVDEFFDALPCKDGVEDDFMPYWGIREWKVPPWYRHVYGAVLRSSSNSKVSRRVRRWLHYDEYCPWLLWILGAGQAHLPRHRNWRRFFESAWGNNPQDLSYLEVVPRWLQEEVVYWGVMKSLDYPEVLDKVMFGVECANRDWHLKFVEQGYFVMRDRSIFQARARSARSEEDLDKIAQEILPWFKRSPVWLRERYESNLYSTLRRWHAAGD